MRSFILKVAAVALVGIITLAPAMAKADDCVSGRVAWAGSPPAGSTRTVVAQVAHVHDPADWIGYTTISFTYVPQHRAGRHLVPAHLEGNGSELYSDRTFCRDTTGGFCGHDQPFDLFNADSMLISLSSEFNTTTFFYDNTRFNYTKSAISYTCLDGNTVSYTDGDAVFVLALKNIETIIPR
jgi:hypothetical protein